jgi:hypothetical protein
MSGTGTGFAAGAPADTLLPGPALARAAGRAWDAGLERLGDDELTGLICSWRRLASWAAAGETAAIAELSERRYSELDGSPEPIRSCDGDHLADELACALTLTSRGADRLLSLACALARLPLTHAALTSGLIDWPKACAIVDELNALDADDAQAAEAAVVPGASRRTTGQLRAALRRAVAALDPDAARRRREKAQKDARVETWTENRGTAALAGRDLPPAEVIAADKRIDTLARWLKKHGTTGSLEQLRARVYTALLTGRPLHTLLPGPRPGGAAPFSPQPSGSGSPSPEPGGAGSSGPRPAGAAPFSPQPGGAPASGLVPPGGTAAGPGPFPADGEPGLPPPGLAGWVNLTLPLATYLGWSGSPGDIAGIGPLDGASCRDLAAWIAAGSTSRWCLTLTDHRGRAIAHGCARDGPGGPPGPRPPGSGGLAGPRGSPGSAGPPAGWPAMPGSHDIAAWLAGLAITPLAAGTCAHEHQTAGYQPRPKLRHRVKIRQRTCSFPGCRRPAVRCDDDHTIAWHQGGRTCECNLTPLCRRHHRAKQAPGWRLQQPEPGTLVWTLPSGRTYTTRPGIYPV